MTLKSSGTAGSDLNPISSLDQRSLVVDNAYKFHQFQQFQRTCQTKSRKNTQFLVEFQTNYTDNSSKMQSSSGLDFNIQ